MRRAVQRELLPAQPGLALELTTGETYAQVVKREKGKRTRLEDSLFAEFRLFGLPLPEREFMFHPTRKWRADFCWVTQKIIVEIEGGIFMRASGRHNRGAYMEQDFEKLNSAAAMGYSVYRFGPKAVKKPKGGIQASKALEFLYPILRGETLAQSRGLPKQG